MINTGNSIGGYSQAARKGIGGLVTGLDTDELVKGMTINTRTKITKQLQNKQYIGWQMDAYRSVSNKLIDFQNKFLSFTSPKNMLSDSFFGNSIINATGANKGYIKAEGDINAAKDLIITKINSLSQTASYNSSYTVNNNVLTTGKIEMGDRNVSSLAGQSININYNGQNYFVNLSRDIAADATADDIVAEFNKALSNIDIDTATAGLQSLGDKIKLSQDGDNFSLKITGSDESTFKIVGGSNDALKALGFTTGSVGKAGSPIEGKDYNTSDFYNTINFNEAMAGKSIVFDFNGVSKKIDIPEGAVFTTAGDFTAFLQDKLNKNFGSGKITVSTNADMSISMAVANSTDKLTFLGASGSNIAGIGGVLGMEMNSSSKLLVTDRFRDINTNIKIDPIGTIKINGKEFSYTEQDTLKDFMARVNSDVDAGVTIKYLETSNTFSIVADEAGSVASVTIEDVSGNLAKALFGQSNITDTTPGYIKGADASISFKVGNGPEQTMTRSNNTFDINGLKVSLTQDAKVGDLGTDPIRFETSTDPTEMVKSIKEMVDSYNEMVDFVNKEYSTKRDRNYTPLTDEQKEGMTEKQIEDWESKAKKGILFGDDSVRSLASDLRFAFSINVPGIEGALSDIGISTSTYWKDNGKIVLDEKKLTKALQEDPEKVKNMFAKNIDSGSDYMSGGVMSRMNYVVNKYAGTVGEKGSLIQKAGLENSYLTEDSTLYKQIEDIDLEVKRLKNLLKSEEDRYYRQFTALEKYTQQMNAQASWLLNQTQG